LRILHRLAVIPGVALILAVGSCAATRGTAVPSNDGTSTTVTASRAVVAAPSTTRKPTPPVTGSSCDSERELRSESGDVATTVEFMNESSRTVKVFWLDYSGTRVYYSTLSPRASIVQPTYVTHPWVVTDSNNDCIMVHVARAAKTVVTIDS